jgi:hypothetical protein
MVYRLADLAAADLAGGRADAAEAAFERPVVILRESEGPQDSEATATVEELAGKLRATAFEAPTDEVPRVPRPGARDAAGGGDLA